MAMVSVRRRRNVDHEALRRIMGLMSLSVAVLGVVILTIRIITPVSLGGWILVAVICSALLPLFSDRAMNVTVVRITAYIALSFWSYLLLVSSEPIELLLMFLFVLWCYVGVVLGLVDTGPRPLPWWSLPRISVPIGHVILDRFQIQISGYQIRPLLYAVAGIPVFLVVVALASL